MKFNVFFTIRGPARSLEVPESHNPTERQDLARLLSFLAVNLPNNPHLGIEVIGIRVVPVIAEEPPPDTGAVL
jgi:hypothetical protein